MDAGRHAHRGGQAEGANRQQQRPGEPVADQIGDRGPVADRGAQLALGQVAQIAEVLLGQRSIEAVVGGQLGPRSVVAQVIRTAPVQQARNRVARHGPGQEEVKCQQESESEEVGQSKVSEAAAARHGFRWHGPAGPRPGAGASEFS